MMINTASKSGHMWTVLLLILFLSPFRTWAYEEIAVANGGTISGVVKFQGQVPKLPLLQITKAKDFCGSVPNESLIVGRDGGLRYAVVTLEGVTKGSAVEREIIHELDNVKCRFVPHVQVASVGQWLVLKNTDPILHTAHAIFAGQPQFNVGLYPGKVSRKPLVSTGVTKIICEVHPWMSAYIVVTEHPYHAVTDLYGEYDIRDIPPGNYKLKVWHESLGTQEKPVEIRSGAVAKVDFLLSLPQGGKK
jgi:plastocyanin